MACFVLKTNVATGMSAEQTRAARCALRAVLAARPGGEGAERMTPAKEDRAKHFVRF